METTAIVDFTIAVPDQVLEDLLRRLSLTRWPPEAKPDNGWQRGTSAAFLKELVVHWRDAYNWRTTERRLNALPHCRTRIDGEDIHFVHVRSPHQQATPVVLLHGWPSSFLEFTKVLGPLAEPVGHGSGSSAFTLVCPSLPGFGLSGPTHSDGWNSRRMADVVAVLMARLGYDRYLVHGSDLGALVACDLALLHPDRLLGIHLDYAPIGKYGEHPFAVDDLDTSEKLALHTMADFIAHDAGYVAVQTTRPGTLGFGLEDSPVGLASWIIDKFRAWSDCGGELESVFSLEELIDVVTLYWVTGTATSSINTYIEQKQANLFGSADRPRIEVPTGVANYAGDFQTAPRAWVEKRYNLVHWGRYAQGGHFPAMEQPELFCTELGRFHRAL